MICAESGAMAQAQSDATSEPQDSEYLNSSKLKIGIFNAEIDSQIAARLVRCFEDNDCEATRYDLLEAGPSKLQLLEDFMSFEDVLVWIATETSLKGDHFMKMIRDIVQYASTRRDGPQFVVFQSREYPNVKLPRVLNAYSPLKEDSHFNDRLTISIKSWRKKKYKKERRARTREHSADGTDAASSQQNPLAGIAPVSDDAMEIATTRYDGPSSVALEAIPDQPKSSSNQSPSSSSKLEQSVNITVNITNSTIQQVNIGKRKETETSTTDWKSKKQDPQNTK